MNCAWFRFYAELNDLLKPAQRKVSFTYCFWGQPAVKDLIESLGVPHTEVDLVLINGQPVDLSHHVRDGDRISVYPAFKTIDIAPLRYRCPVLPSEVRFILDTHLGRLASYLRMTGFDALYSNKYQDAELAQLSVQEHRILLTRNRNLLKRGEITHGYLVRENEPKSQLVEILNRFNLFHAIKPFRRCIPCNGLLKRVPKKEVEDRLPPRTREYYQIFYICSNCGRIYWPGSHYENMKKFIQEIQGIR